jgi:hypothetical protein
LLFITISFRVVARSGHRPHAGGSAIDDLFRGSFFAGTSKFVKGATPGIRPVGLAEWWSSDGLDGFPESHLVGEERPLVEGEVSMRGRESRRDSSCRSASGSRSW